MPTNELLPVMPMDDVVVLPHMTVTLAVEGDTAKAAIEAARQGNRLILLVPRIEGKYGTIGTVARLGDSAELPTGAEAFMLRGEYRARLGSGQADIGGALWVKAEPLPDPDPASPKAIELSREYRAMLENLVESRGVPQVVQFLRAAKSPGHLADLAGYSPDLTTDQKLEVLETVDLEERLTKLISWMKQILADASLKEKIRSDVAEGMEKTQREFLLRQQMEAIKKQLNEGGSDVVTTYREKVAKAGMPEAVLVEVERELGRL
jgi:ATP-dependent Lon protease